MANLMPGEWDWQVQDADRKRKFAELLRQTPSPQGQMVGNIYVAPSWTQQLASAVKNFQGNQLLKQADEQEKNAVLGRQKKMQDAAKRLGDALAVKPAMVGNNTDDANMMNNPGAYSPAQSPSTDDILRAQLMYANEVGDPNLLNQVTSNIVSNQIRQQDRRDDREYRDTVRKDEQAFRAEQGLLERQARQEALREQIAAREAAGRDAAELRRELAQNQANLQRELAASRKNGADPYFQAIQTPQGIMKFNARTGQMEPVMVNGAPVMKSSDDPSLQGQLSEAKAGGKERGEAKAQAQLGLPQVVSQGNETIQLVDDLLNHPGFDSAVGTSSLNPLNKLPGTDGKDFNIRLDQLKGKQFLQAFESLKGGGAITEVEGKKATDAISRMNTAASEGEFRKAAQEFQTIIRNGVARAQQKAGVAEPSQPQRVKRYNPKTGRIE